MSLRRRSNSECGREDAEKDRDQERSWASEEGQCYAADDDIECEFYYDDHYHDNEFESEEQPVCYPWFNLETTDTTAISLIYPDDSQVDVMEDGQVFAWILDIESHELMGYHYKNKQAYNDNMWSVKGYIDKNTHQPLGECTVFCEDTHITKNVYYWEDGSCYEGSLDDNRRATGYGTFTWANGEKYIGHLFNGRREGEGCMYWPAEKDSFHFYKGTFANDNMEDYGTLTFADGCSYIGHFTCDMIDGHEGTFTWPNGDSYTGTFTDNKIDLNYRGTFTFHDGDRYSGNIGRLWGTIIDPNTHKIQAL